MNITNKTKDLILEIDGEITVVPKEQNGAYLVVSGSGGTITIGSLPVEYNKIQTPSTTSATQLISLLYTWIHEVDNIVSHTDCHYAPVEIVGASTVGSTGDGKRYLPIIGNLANTRITDFRPFHITAGSGSDTEITVQRLRPATKTTWTTSEVLIGSNKITIVDGELWGYDKDYLDADGESAAYSTANAAAIDPDNSILLLGDMLKFNIDAWCTNAEGLIVSTIFKPL